MLGLGIRHVELGRRPLAASLHEFDLLFVLLTKPSLAARGPTEIEKFLRQVAAENGLKINFDTCPGCVCKKQPASNKKKPADDLYSDDSDLESCDDEDDLKCSSSSSEVKKLKNGLCLRN